MEGRGHHLIILFQVLIGVVHGLCCGVWESHFGFQESGLASDDDKRRKQKKNFGWNEILLNYVVVYELKSFDDS